MYGNTATRAETFKARFNWASTRGVGSVLKLPRAFVATILLLQWYVAAAAAGRNPQGALWKLMLISSIVRGGDAHARLIETQRELEAKASPAATRARLSFRPSPLSFAYSLSLSFCKRDSLWRHPRAPPSSFLFSQLFFLMLPFFLFARTNCLERGLQSKKFFAASEETYSERSHSR